MELPCQVRSKTESPCPNLSVVEIRGIAFCETCAREQEAYFAIGELTQQTQSLRNKRLVELLERMRRKRTGGRGGVTAEMHHDGLPGAETERPAFSGGWSSS